jgi:hypothetical protein
MMTSARPFCTAHVKSSELSFCLMNIGCTTGCPCLSSQHAAATYCVLQQCPGVSFLSQSVFRKSARGNTLASLLQGGGQRSHSGPCILKAALEKKLVETFGWGLTRT